MWTDHAQRESPEIFGVDPMPSSCKIAALQGAPSATIQALLADYALRATAQGHKIAGVVELAMEGSGGACGRRAVRDLSTGAITLISQNLGAGSTACNLDPSGLIEVCASVEHAIATGPDLVILSKFGKLEADRGGLNGAFRAAIGAGLPILTAVAPSMSAAWERFAGPLARFIPADESAIDTWWSNIRTEMPLLVSS